MADDQEELLRQRLRRRQTLRKIEKQSTAEEKQARLRQEIERRTNEQQLIQRTCVPVHVPQPGEGCRGQLMLLVDASSWDDDRKDRVRELFRRMKRHYDEHQVTLTLSDNEKQLMREFLSSVTRDQLLDIVMPLVGVMKIEAPQSEDR
jgi:hypothetical protein